MPAWPLPVLWALLWAPGPARAQDPPATATITALLRCPRRRLTPSFQPNDIGCDTSLA